MDLLIDKIKKIRARSLSAEDNIKRFLEKIKREDNDLHSFLHINEKAVEQARDVDRSIKKGKYGILAGLAVAVKSNISVQGLPITCASKTLENYTGSYDADVIQNIRKEDGIIIGMTNMDEFACGSSGENSAVGPTGNPAAKGMIPGGSSSGSAAAVAAGFCDIALGSDTGGSIRNPASHCGVCGIKPSYGRVSRYGLIDLSMSLDCIGPLSKDVYGCALMLEVIAGHSRNDPTTFNRDVPNYTSLVGKSKTRMKIGVCRAFDRLCVDKRISQLVNSSIQRFAECNKSTIVEVELSHVDLAVQTYYPLVYVEFFSGTRKFDGRKYGRKIEDNCGEEVLRRILGGYEISRAEYHGRYYRKALAAQKVIKESINKAFKKVDFLMLPTTPLLPHGIGTKIDAKAMYAYDAFTLLANLAGNCAGVVNCGMIDKIPVGLQVFAPVLGEDILLKVMATAERVLSQ